MKEKLLELFSQNYMLTLDEICDLVENDYDMEEIIDTLENLENDNIIYKGKKGNYGLLKSFNLYKGTITLKKQGFGFFTSPDLTEDVFVAPLDLGNALDGDIVLCYVDNASYFPSIDKKREGKVRKVISHTKKLICIVNSYDGINKVLECDTYPDLKIKTEDFGVVVSGDLVLTTVLKADLTRRGIIEVSIDKIIGNINDVDANIKSVIYEYGLEPEFNDDVLENIKEINEEYLKNIDLELKRRERINKTIITIDGEDAKDLDDAVSVNKLSNGNYFLGVYIADVSYFVRKGSKVDDAALERGTSVYLVDRVIPMLPHKLCNDLCSLNEHTDKLAIGCEMIIDKSGKVIESTIKECVINSTHRMTYTNVNRIINDDIDEELTNKYSDIFKMVKEMNELKSILNRMRELRGSLTFDIPEAKIIVDETLHPIDVKKIERGEGEKLIEEFMLIANETVAQTITNLNLPFIYRIHDEPNTLKLERFKRILKNTKYDIKTKGKKITPLALQGLLNEINGNDSSISTMILRMMAKAKYSIENIGHYGLASKCYTHFTSPIRRYPDLLVHRLIREYLFNSSEFFKDYDKKELDFVNYISNVAIKSSDREVNAQLLEYEVSDMKKAEYMEDHIGEKYVGKIVSLTNFGFFVSLDNTIEGLVSMRSLSDDYYEYNDYQMAIIGRSKNKVYKLGDKVEVQVTYASSASKEIDFKLTSSGKTKDSVLKYTKGVYKHGKRRN